jgi:SAM-dependent methyltransferase
VSKAHDGKKTPDGATPRRVRSAGPRDRSGPIGISSGDFSTPLVRKRTTTQPRGVPVVGGKAAPPSLDEPVTAATAIQDEIEEPSLTPPPEIEPEPAASVADLGAMPTPADADAIPVAMPIRPPPPPVSGDESPFGGGDMDAEAAALAAEAAAVRALDSGPLTPPPELMPPPATPAAANDVDEDAPTPPPQVSAAPKSPPPEVTTRTPPPDVSETPGTPAPEITLTGAPPADGVAATAVPEIAAPQTPAPEVKAAPEITVTRTPPPELVAATRTPPPEDPVAARTPPPYVPDDHSSPIAAAAAAAAEADQVTPPPELRPPVAAPDTDGYASPAMSADPDAGLAALPVAALTDAGGSDPSAVGPDGEVDGDEHVEMMEGTEEDAVAVSPAAQARSLRNAAPPPIPGSHLKTPGAELLRAEPVDASAVPPVPVLPEAITQRPRRPKRSKPWFEEVFDEDYLRTLPFMRADQTLREVEFISDALRIEPGAEILDIACGYGRHAIELVQRGYNVTGLDLSLPLLLRAADESKRRALSVNFVHADMREMAFEKQFDGAYSMLTSFGYFDEDTNLRVAERIGRALKPGARFLLDLVNRDYVVSDLPARVWWEGTGCVVLEEVDFNFHTSRIVTHRSIVFEDGRQLEQEISVRAYSLHEIGRLLRQAGFRVMDVSGGLNTRGQFFGNASRSLLIVAEKRESDAAQPL